MPTFDFQCKKCNHIFEFARAFGSDVKPACPTCSSKRVEKLIAPPAVHFKGSGWYKTDSKTASAAPVKKKEEKKETPNTESQPAEAKPTETKPVEKKDSAKKES
ncbi:MAG: zinc ribbon domain-containing protein [Candidatus Peribacteraceae bacterium]|nr:zinc ribbon domain-containing protein [Candidatus Peribacteraceae bacterium]